MKTLTTILFAATLSAAAVSYAGPGPQFWNRPAPNSAPLKARTTEMVAPADNSNLMCARMWVPKPAGAKQADYTVVRCTPEMMAKNDWRCQQACAQAMKKG